MKSLSSNALPLCLAVLFVVPLSAQQSNRMRFGIQGSASFPMGNYAEEVGIGFGGSIFLEKGLGDIIFDNLSIRGNFYYLLDGEKEIKVTETNYTSSDKMSAASVGFLADIVYNWEYGYPGLYIFGGLGFNSTKMTLNYYESTPLHNKKGKVENTTSGAVTTFGAGYYFTKNIGTEIRFVNSTDNAAENAEDKVTLSWVRVSLTLRF